MRTYSLGEYAGDRVSIKTVKDRRLLIGKLVGYDLFGSCMLHYGRVTAVYGREIEIDGSPRGVGHFEQVVVLHDQGAGA